MRHPFRSLHHATFRTARRALFGALTAAAVGVAAGCSNNPYPASDDRKTVVYLNVPEDLKTLDPSISYQVEEGTIITLVCDTYFNYHYLKRPAELILALGAIEPKREKWPVTVTEGGKQVQKTGERWTFRLKKGVRYQNDPCFPGGKGREITAADMVTTFKRIADPSIASPILAFLQDKMLGMDEFYKHNEARVAARQATDYDFPLTGISVDPKDPYTFTITLSQPYPQLRFLMAMGFTTPIPMEAIKHYKNDFTTHPVGCGPYVLKEWARNERIVLARNPNYRADFYPTEGEAGDAEKGLLKDAGQRLPFVDEVRFTVVREAVTQWNFFLQGYLDRSGIPRENFNTTITTQGGLSEEMARNGISLNRTARPDIYYYIFNMRDPVVGGYTEDKKKLRQALSMAIDMEEFIKVYLNGRGIPAQFIYGPGIFGYDPNYKNPYRQFNVEKAKQLLAEAGYPNGISRKTGDRLTISYINSATTSSERQQIVFLQQQWDQIGVRLDSRTSDENTRRDRLDKGQFQFAAYGWLPDYPDAENFLLLIYGPNRRPGPNASNYDNPRFNQLYERMRSMDDTPERLAMIRDMRDIVNEDVPLIYMYHPVAYGLTHQWVSNFKTHPISLNGIKHWRIDRDERRTLWARWNRPQYAWPLGILGVLALGSVPAVVTVRRRAKAPAKRRWS
jgi:oligopeptide transport system substrate-binding protein